MVCIRGEFGGGSCKTNRKWRFGTICNWSYKQWEESGVLGVDGSCRTVFVPQIASKAKLVLVETDIEKK